tara:strand:- start:12 stop:758 length:747 start_codon:yes stop_codon:yes gene_type:complete
VCTATAAVIGVSQGFSALQGASQARARNKAARRQYEDQLKQREANWYQSLTVWGARRNKYYAELNENDLAAQRGYTQAQQGLNDVFAAAAQRNEQALIKYFNQSGKLAAAGRTGRTADRIATLDIAALERQAGKELYRLTRSEEAFKQNVTNIRNAQRSQRNKLFANVAFAPVPGLTPPPPVYENASPVLGLLSAGLQAAAQGGMFDGGPGNAAGSQGDATDNVWNQYALQNAGANELYPRPYGSRYS